MLNSAERLRLKRDFEAVFAARRSVPGRLVRLAYTDNHLSLTRVGIVTSTKVSKKAVVRNKIRRRLRSIFKQELPRLSATYDIVCLCSPATASVSFQELREDVVRALDNLGKRKL